MSTTTTYPQKFTGSITWLYPSGKFQSYPVPRAIRRSFSEIVIDCNCGTTGKPYLYTITLRWTAENRFEGHFTAGYLAEDQTTGILSGRLYSSSSDLVIRGTWHEEGDSDFIAELLGVAHFPDENPVS